MFRVTLRCAIVPTSPLTSSVEVTELSQGSSPAGWWLLTVVVAVPGTPVPFWSRNTVTPAIPPSPGSCTPFPLVSLNTRPLMVAGSKSPKFTPDVLPPLDSVIGAGSAEVCTQPLGIVSRTVKVPGAAR